MALVEIINDSNTVLIDDEYANASVAVKGNVTLVPSGVNFGSSQCDRVIIEYTTGYNNLQFALELSDIKVVSLFTFKTGNTWSFHVYFHKDYYNRNLRYFLFTVPDGTPNVGGLVQMFNSSGQLTFDSNLDYLRVEGFYNSPRANSTITDGLDPNKTYGVISVTACFLSSHLMNPPNQPGPPYTFMDASGCTAFSRSGNSLMSWSVSTGGSITQTNENTQWIADISNGRLMLIDITGF